MIELNVPYTGKDLADEFGIPYGTFRNKKDYYVDLFNKCYEWHKEKAKYVFTKQLAEMPIKRSKHDTQLMDTYVPLLVQEVGQECWGTALGITKQIYTNNPIEMQALDHLLSTAYSYVREALKMKYAVIDKQWAVCKPGETPRAMTAEEVQEWYEIKKSIGADRGQLTELAEKKSYGYITDKEFIKNVKRIAATNYARALTE